MIFRTNKITNYTKIDNRYLEDKNIDFILSKDAGSYLCNNIYFEGLDFINKNNLKIKMIFIHIPSKNEAYDFDKLAKYLSNFMDLLY